VGPLPQCEERIELSGGHQHGEKEYFGDRRDEAYKKG